MSWFAVNLLLAGLWMGVMKMPDFSGAIIGFCIGYFVLAVVSKLYSDSGYHRRLWMIATLVLVFMRELIVSSFIVLWDVITPGQGSSPGFIAMPLDAKSDAEIFFTANLISLTPGTLSIAISDDRKCLFIHAMFLEDRAQTMANLKAFEASILGAFR